MTLDASFAFAIAPVIRGTAGSIEVSGDDVSNEQSAAHTVARRSIVRGAAWSVPVVATAIAAPLAAASINDIGHFEFFGLCGDEAQGVHPGFQLTADPRKALPAGLTLIFHMTDGRAVLPLDVTNGHTSQTSDGWEDTLTLLASVPPGQSMTIRSAYAAGTGFRLNATIVLPADTTTSNDKLYAAVESYPNACAIT